jgi:quinol monooxygenase YgiN
MIVVVGRVRTDDERRSELLRAGQALAAASREEEGCLGYRLYQDTEDPQAYVFVEEWQDDGALQRHFGTAHIAAFMAAVPQVVIGAPDVHFHDVSRSRDLTNVTAG